MVYFECNKKSDTEPYILLASSSTASSIPRNDFSGIKRTYNIYLQETKFSSK